ncbi:NAD(P)/FAD-dependent oxidoreductase [Acinetobacter larvae]|uniref:D-amino-acid oxidase n=1 Tax=Acinetobacter larvae TaxID=1789224 RepID=A0A1B2M1K0_9GAMM|nr:FAD-dependent oxidoreductase [Acinetobacter larvae]AOA59065.1 D-amino-acid oxidase [Acinetobacter larvae]
MHIAIIGAGISGLLCAFEFLEQGCHVSLYDQQHFGRAASWAGGGILSPMYPWRYPDAVNQLARHGKALYQHYNAQLLPQTAIDFEIEHSGMLIFDADDFAIGQAYAEKYQDPMQRCQHVQSEQLQRINPRLAATWQQALYFPALSNIRNPRVLQSLQAYVQQHPRAQVYPQHTIQQFKMRGQRIDAAITQHNEQIYADHFVLATGAWSAEWEQQLRCHIPVAPVQGQMLLFKTPAHWLPTMCMNDVMYLIPRRDGHIVCGSSVRHCGFDTRPDTHISAKIYAASIAMVPELAHFPIIKQWAGLRPGSPDGIPYIGAMPEIDNLWANFGHYRNGLCMGPAAARLLRQLLLAQQPFIDPSAYSTTRLHIDQQHIAS